MLAQWAAAGAPSGDLAAVPAPPAAIAQGWRLGEPDLVVEMAEPFTVPAGGDDVFRTFVLPVDLGGARRRWVKAVEIVPGSARVVHHGTLMADPTDSSRRLDAADATPGFDGMRTFSRARAPDGHLVGWTPGMAPSVGRDDLAWELAAGTDLVLELHLVPSGREETLRARAGLHFAAAPPPRRPLAVRLGLKTIDIPAGEVAYREQDRFVLPAAVDVLAVYPHAHYRCRSMRATATLPDGRVETLLDIRAWDFDWQDQYRYRDPIRLPAGTGIAMEYVFDNSAANPRNPQQPPRRVVYGPAASDEMGDLWLQVVAVEDADAPRLSRALEQRESESNLAGWRAALARTPDDATLHFNLGSELVLTGELDAGIAELERSVELDPAFGRALTNLGNAFVARARRSGGESARADLERAAQQFERATSVSDATEAPDALFNLANTEAALGRFDDAHRSYDRALELRPAFHQARLNKATTYARQERRGDAIAEIERCLDADPTYVAALWNLALLRGQEPAGMAAALERVDRALAIEPASPALRMLRGDLLLRLERFDDATAAYRAVIEVDPRSADAWANLGRSLARQGRVAEAEQALARALEIDARNAAALEVRRELAR